MQNLHYNLKYGGPNKKDAKIESWLGSVENELKGLGIFVVRIRVVGIPEKQKNPIVQLQFI